MGPRSFKATTVYAGYRQFYLLDAVHPGDTDADDFWSEDAMCARLAVADGAIGIGTKTYGDVPVALEVHDTEPTISLDSFDHVAEASLVTRSGSLTIAGCPDFPTDVVVDVSPGRWRVRLSVSGLQGPKHETKFNGDEYRLQIWPSDERERHVLKLCAEGA